LKAAYGYKSLMHRRRDQFLGDGPLEDAADAFDAGVDRLAAPLLFDEFLPHGLERQRTEFGGKRLAVQFANVAEWRMVAFRWRTSSVGFPS
jgi:hypothetical protein